MVWHISIEIHIYFMDNLLGVDMSFATRVESNGTARPITNATRTLISSETKSRKLFLFGYWVSNCFGLLNSPIYTIFRQVPEKSGTA